MPNWLERERHVFVLCTGRKVRTVHGRGKKLAGPEGKVAYGGYIAMKTAQGNVVPWLASQTDVLAEDWCVYLFEHEAEGVR